MLAEDPDVRPSAAEVALSLYRAGPAEPVGLVGHHPDPAAAVTTRIRREAAETRSRSQLREAERAEHRLRRREVRRSRLRRLWFPWRLRLALVVAVGLVLAGGMLGALRLTGGPLEVTTAPVADTSGASSAGDASGTSAAGDASGTSAAGDASGTSALDGVSAGPSASPTPTPTPSMISGTAAPNIGPAPIPSPAGEAAPSPTPAASMGPPGVGPAQDPVGVLQRLADQRAEALMAADPVQLVGVEPAGSSAHQTDRQTIERLREQRQRYAELSFMVRSAEVFSQTSDIVVLRAVVDRSAYRVITDGSDPHTVDAAPGTALRYTLSMADGAWRLTEVSAL
jgi:hypothetical protein